MTTHLSSRGHFSHTIKYSLSVITRKNCLLPALYLKKIFSLIEIKKKIMG